MLGHWDSSLDVSWEAFMSDDKDDYFEPLGRKVYKIKDCLVLQLLQSPHLKDYQALALTHSPYTKFLS